jgi:hypothetical protein
MTTRDIQGHMAEVYGAEVSPALISRVTDVVADEITAWQTRPVDQGRFLVNVANHLSCLLACPSLHGLVRRPVTQA